ncbi:hypothetical protein MAPG_05232 [Magnaporthiopsis poae ATCC 64411]|uniref:LysM domain-containing protein n=1 Tax=Magnaporthiopsis poae (strain ATCC 64411 / 73-15) TaxID=644358 RepID=A0A0C4DYV3_MAGP6|nr:hypothetical protein MAPG_05232 [Magnaporthiopsis poae ATCC 64411]
MSATTTTSRPRQRRAGSAGLADDGSKSKSTSTSLLAAGPTSSSSSRRVSPSPSSRNPSSTRASDASSWTVGGGGASSSLGKGLWDSGLAPAWASVQGFASSILSGESSYGSDTDRQGDRNRSRTRRPTHRMEHTSPRWGLDYLLIRADSPTGITYASVLESHEGVNGGLDVAGKFKRRSSDEDLRGSSAAQSQEPEEYLAYVHHVQPSDTYAGIVLRYRCREDAFRKANGLWSRDNIQIRSFLVIPVDACEVKGRACGPPSYYSQGVDLLASTPGKGGDSKDVDDFFNPFPNGKVAEQPPPMEDAHPWTHVRWVALESFKTPVEIARVSRRHTGYFPPRRKKSVHTATTLSTPRGSMDLPSVSVAESVESPSSTSSRRLGCLSNRPQGAGHVYSASVPSPSTARSRGGSVGQEEHRPAWMRRPGGVGSLGRTVRAPGPEKDYFNVFARKHFPGIGIDSLPSMSVMGSETARFGFDPEANGIVESPFEGGRDAASAASAAAAAGRNGTSLEQAAATVEMWLRGAFAKRSSGSMSPGLRWQTLQHQQHQQHQQPHHARHSSEFDTAGYSDLIELEDTNSEDGRLGGASSGPGGIASLLSSTISAAGASGRSGGDDSALRGRTVGAGGGVGKGKKAD